MILVDALYINNSGGKVLLDYLVHSFEKKGLDCFYVFDDRVSGSYEQVSEERKVYLTASLKNRYTFYKLNKNRFSQILCFGNLPPLIKNNATVYTYFHQYLYIKLPESIKGLQKLKYLLKIGLFKKLIKNTDYFIVQSGFIKRELQDTFRLKEANVLVLPFYPPLSISGTVSKEKNTFLYVSAGSSYKNHKRLLNAFAAYFEKHKVGRLILTIGEEYPDVVQQINDLQKKGIPVTNIGFVHRDELARVYQQAEFLMYPSLKESFGLGLIEAIEANCKVLGADLPYTYEVCIPSLAFDPFSEDAILHAFEKAASEELQPTVPSVTNQIEDLMELLSGNR